MQPQRLPPQLHYHIRWSRVVALDWECFSTFAEAEDRAKELVRRDETYIVEEHDEACPRCRVAMSLKTDHDAPMEPVSTLKYPWQPSVLDAFMEARPELAAWKVNAAEQAISVRLCDNTPAAPDEQIAIREALQSLRALLPETKKESGQRSGSERKKATA